MTTSEKVISIISLLFVAPDLLALHDILHREPDITLELLTLGVSFLPFAMPGVVVARRAR